MAEQAGIYAVATGDIVKSSALSAEARRRLPEALREVGELVRQGFPGALAPGTGVDVFRGDSWQMLITDWPRALRICLLLYAGLKSMPELPRVHTRISIAVGPVDVLPRERASEGSGEAYTASGRLLDELSVARPALRLSFSLMPLIDAVSAGPESGHCLRDSLEITEAMCGAVSQLLGAVVWRWSAAQARAVLWTLLGKTQEDIAAGWPEAVSQQAIADLLAKASWARVDAALADCEDVLDRSAAACNKLYSL